MFSKPLSPSTMPKTNTSHFESGSQLEVIQLEWLFFSAFNIITFTQDINETEFSFI